MYDPTVTAANRPVSLFPMVLRVAPAFRVSDEEFFAFGQQNPEWNIEKSAKGEWIFMPPTGGATGDTNSEIN